MSRIETPAPSARAAATGEGRGRVSGWGRYPVIESS